MPVTKLSDEEFLLRITPLLNKKGVLWRHLAEASGYSIGAVRGRIEKLRREGKVEISAPPKMFVARIPDRWEAI